MIIIGQVSGTDRIENAFEVVDKTGGGQIKNYALYPSDSIYAITSKDRYGLVQAKYGLIPFWMKIPKALFEAPVEGKINRGETPVLKKGIVYDPLFRRPVRESRAVIPIDYFILSEGGSTMLFFTGRRPFALAGLTDFWKPPTPESKLCTGIAILTLPARGIFKECGFRRQPMVIEELFWRPWLKDISLTQATSMIGYFPDGAFNGYPVNGLAEEKGHNKSIVLPTGNFYRDHKKTGMGQKIRSKTKKGATNDESGQEQRIWRSPLKLGHQG